MTLKVRRNERELLRNSHIIKDYKWLQNLLENHETISEQQIESLPPDQQRFFENLYHHVLDQAIKEWESDYSIEREDLETDTIHCSLCNTKNRYVYFIKNTLNGNELNVGSTCINSFKTNIAGLQDLSPTQHRRQIKRLRLQGKLDSRFPGIEETIDGWFSSLNEYEVIIPSKFGEPYLELARKAKNLVDEYLKEKRGDEIFNELEQLYKDRDKQVIKIKHYVAINRSDKYIPTREIGIWLQENKKHQTLKQLRRDGKITRKTIGIIKEPQFMKKIIPDLNRHLRPIGLKIERADTNQKGYVIVAVALRNIYLFRKHFHLLSDYGGLLFDVTIDKPFNFDKLIMLSSIYDDSSYELIIERLKTLVKNSSINISTYYIDYNEVAFFERITGKYVIDKLKKVADQFKGLVFQIEGICIRDLEEYVKHLRGERYTQEEYKEYEKSRSNFV